MVISGNNFQNGIQRTSYSYYFSRYNHCWGWATWKRAWKYYDFHAEKWLKFKQERLLEQLFEDSVETKYWQQIFDRLFLEGKPNSWDYAWTFACWAQGGLSILPNHNLVSNIGFRSDATHTHGSESLVANLPTQDIWKILHPPFIVRHQEADLYTFKSCFYNNSWASKVKRIPKKVKSTLGFK
ncbi:hypothetical protein [Picosynechococcus sp. NKBG042902]|uniref:hypothetical protein n=1 Tax=Picosynechococcus sp. NKBG042902 TaxID=490193 RepID=UPI000A443CA3|nr:hypothetical protein [Picosynechococcus sp. NKBG042902]